MMAALVDIGRGEAQVELLRETLRTGASWEQGSIAPASGLQLVTTELAVDDQ